MTWFGLSMQLAKIVLKNNVRVFIPTVTCTFLRPLPPHKIYLFYLDKLMYMLFFFSDRFKKISFHSVCHVFYLLLLVSMWAWKQQAYWFFFFKHLFIFYWLVRSMSQNYLTQICKALHTVSSCTFFYSQNSFFSPLPVFVLITSTYVSLIVQPASHCHYFKYIFLPEWFICFSGIAYLSNTWLEMCFLFTQGDKIPHRTACL